MQDDEIAAKILAFATHIGAADTDAATTARSRGWLTDDGTPTDDGRSLVASLDDQGQTRTVFRGNF